MQQEQELLLNQRQQAVFQLPLEPGGESGCVPASTENECRRESEWKRVCVTTDHSGGRPEDLGSSSTERMISKFSCQLSRQRAGRRSGNTENRPQEANKTPPKDVITGTGAGRLTRFNQ